MALATSVTDLATAASGAPADPGASTTLVTDGIAGPLGRIHPIGVVAAGLAVIAVVSSLVGTDYLIGNLAWWHWILLALTFAISLSFPLIHRLRLALEAVPDFMIDGIGLSGRLGSALAAAAALAVGVVSWMAYGGEAAITTAFAVGIAVGSIALGPVWVLAWGVFLLSLFNVITRYTARFINSDIIIAEVSSLAWQTFALITLLGVGYGVKAGVNPRIDFWWAEFSNKTKAWLDFVLHIGLYLPFLLMAGRTLWSFAGISLGYKPDRSGQGLKGEWPQGWKVWETWEQHGDAGQLPVGPIQALMFVAFCFFAAQIIAEVIKHGFTIIGREDLGGLVEHDAPLRVE